MKGLKKCPFCNSSAIIFSIPENTEEENRKHPKWVWKHSGMYAIGCTNGTCIMSIEHFNNIYLTKELAKEAWNKRAEV